MRPLTLALAVLCCAIPGAAQLIPLPPSELPGSKPVTPTPAAASAKPAAEGVPANTPVPGSIATVSVEGVSVSGSLNVANGRASIGSDGTIAAGDRTADVALTRGGTLKVCASTKVHLTTDNSVNSAGPGGPLMIALDRGALEAHYTSGQYSDVLLTPDLRILISPPGHADVSIRVADNGDTCVDNHGDQAPYVLASSQFGEGAYRVQPNQRVLFEHGSLSDVVDNEPEPCGCPPDQPNPAAPQSLADSGVTGKQVAKPGEAVAENSAEKPNPTAAQNPFPLAESEGLKPPSAAPAVPPGETHVQVTAPLNYDSTHPDLPPAPANSATVSGAESPAPIPVPTSAIHVAQAAPPPAQAKPKPKGFFGHIGHFFKRMFGG